jgi:NTP-dependent ternary system trypsin peptidase co-occuring protein
MNMRWVGVIGGCLVGGCWMGGTACWAQQQAKAIVAEEVCSAPKVAAAAVAEEKKGGEQPAGTADLARVVQLVDHALKCYQALSKDLDPLQPKGLPKISSATMDFKTTTGKTVGFSLSIFVFKVGASREKDVTDDIAFTYSVPKVVAPGPKGITKPVPADLFAELVKEVAAAANAAQAQSTALGMPLSKVQITVSYGIKFDGNVAVSVPISLVTIGGNGDYNKNDTQTITLTFGQ